MTATVSVDTRRERSLAALFGGWTAFAFGPRGEPATVSAATRGGVPAAGATE